MDKDIASRSKDLASMVKDMALGSKAMSAMVKSVAGGAKAIAANRVITAAPCRGMRLIMLGGFYE
jgi:hypothetical protein